MDDETRKERKSPQTEKILRQFLKMESGAYTRPSYRANLDLALKGSEALAKPAPCDHCDFIARTIAEIHWHEDHNHGHECCPDNPLPLGTEADLHRCKKCARVYCDCEP